MASIGIWLLCIVSLLGVRYYNLRKPVSKDFILKGRTIFEGLNSEEKTNIVRYDTAIIRLSDERYQIIGRGHESEEKNLLEDDTITTKRIDFRIDDPILLERQFMVKEAYQYLNNAEKKCFADHFAVILNRNGEYVLYVDKDKYAEYALKYGTECKPCNEAKKTISKK